MLGGCKGLVSLPVGAMICWGGPVAGFYLGGFEGAAIGLDVAWSQCRTMPIMVMPAGLAGVIVGGTFGAAMGFVLGSFTAFVGGPIIAFALITDTARIRFEENLPKDG
jgi:hypothetical protein